MPVDMDRLSILKVRYHLKVNKPICIHQKLVKSLMIYILKNECG